MKITDFNTIYEKLLKWVFIYKKPSGQALGFIN